MTNPAPALPEKLHLSDGVLTSSSPQHNAQPIGGYASLGYIRITGERDYAEAIIHRYNAHAALVAERNAYRKSLEQAVAWARAKCERIGVAEEAWLEDARALLRSDT